MLAAANSVFGRWDDTKGEDNIDFMPTILSRFDMIFIIKDQHDQQRDMVCGSNCTIRGACKIDILYVELVLVDEFVFCYLFLDACSSRDERASQCSDTDRGSGGRNSFGHVEEIHCLCPNVSLLPFLLYNINTCIFSGKIQCSDADLWTRVHIIVLTAFILRVNSTCIGAWST